MPRPVLYKTPEEKRKADAEKARRWRERNPERAKAAKARWAEKNPDYNSEYSKAYYEKNTEKVKAKHAEWRADNADHLKQKERKRYEANPEASWDKFRRWREANPERVRELNLQKSTRWRLANPDKRCAMETRRRTQMMRAYPAWADDELIAEVYALARLRTELTGISWEVDHIVPLNSDLVCGLHWEGNLQVIPAAANLAKSNDWWPDMPDAPAAVDVFHRKPSEYLTGCRR
jgi:hypothetical protein